MKLISGLLMAILLIGCSNKALIIIGDDDLINAAINIPRAIKAKNDAPVCRYEHPDKRAACRDKKKNEVDEMAEAMKKKD